MASSMDELVRVAASITFDGQKDSLLAFAMEHPDRQALTLAQSKSLIDLVSAEDKKSICWMGIVTNPVRYGLGIQECVELNANVLEEHRDNVYAQMCTHPEQQGVDLSRAVQIHENIDSESCQDWVYMHICTNPIHFGISKTQCQLYAQRISDTQARNAILKFVNSF